ncbi:crotonase/enoyl-CoA hydratase family protein [Bordetella genomosp. 6]|uniref:crotonase/enoyl-CoA hydratase family protein n=1 Tax=Bordetella genomosp. 6 TaxID=463024 RepID=UPI000A29443D|nr:crotonase/enoyl-CoA hydratase family protein [Bordetella genomosp. 6]ARP77702.1 enoyl-CoA hydratase [Bordetella genomosp. 6]
MSSKIIIERTGAITTITINRPAARNACDLETLHLLVDAFAEFERDPGQHVAVLTGADGMFCAGGDLKELSVGKGIGYAWAGDKGPLQRRPSKPVIAAVHGHAVAAGLALAVWCDLRVIDDSAVFGVFCRRFGAPMTNGASVRLPRLIGESAALDMFLTGRPVEAREAMEIGLANRLAPKGQTVSMAQALAAEIAAFPQVCLRSDRESMLGQWGMPEDEAIRREVRFGQAAFQEESQAGAARFVRGEGRHGDFGAAGGALPPGGNGA